MSSETTEVKLIKQEDWPAWFDFIQSEANIAKIWRFVNPGENNVPTNVEPDVFYYTKDRSDRSETSTPGAAHTANEMSTPSSSTELSIDPRLEQYLAGQDSAGR